MNSSIINRNTFSVLFFIHRGKKNIKKEHPIYCRLTVQGKSKEFSTQIWVANDKWNPKTHKVLGKNEVANTANHTIESARNNLLNIRADLYANGKEITASAVINIHLGKVEVKYTLLELLDHFNEYHVKKLIGKDYTKGTYERYKTSLNHVKEFMIYKNKSSDLLLTDINYAFATEYEFYLKTVRNNSHNTSLKYIKNLKAVVNFAVRNEWLTNNPLDRYQVKLEKIDKAFLTQKELNAIEYKEITSSRINEVKDIFVFCCYTGLAFSDVAKLSNKDIIIGINGEKQISIRRTKTDVTANIPILSKAADILKKYESNEFCIYNEKLLPVKSNQKHNAYLKEIADLCGITKKLTTHTARHTFATLMLTKGASIETVSSMLGHTNIKTTQIYSKVINEKVFTEMTKINKQFKAATA